MNLPTFIKLPKISLPIPASVKQKLPTLIFILLIPLGVLVGYFFSNIKAFMAGGYKNLLTPVDKIMYVAKVDGVGIPRGEWDKMLKTRYGKTAAKDLIDVYIVRNELKKAGITVSDAEIDAEMANIEKQLGGQSLESILSQQGRTLADFRSDMYLQVGVNKMFGPKVTVTDEEVAQYVTTLGDSITGATPEEKNASARKTLTDQKIGNEVGAWFSSLQATVKVENYLD
ncbi:TPA: hypothetical protein DCY43_04250 [candidate division WWE3 bacterium]|uniref:PpiC-type peptidyl-prolyl cis-trans isomerase n=3 Tax=Katanobacteria TaxID=422282 RepID=A0A0G1MVR7_UNCKA|nr:MAG: PpiC-type peptidyl-prolyl cis-trans isomerase [candidate division WWE3 bacterium GW2011_GWB1_44_4]KKT84867.1 MAG: PpiC-type peptidyl-prolyl cis-trans isomerase [candidate division WWE3 bacterium GW2011_GWC2_44_9]HAZ29916.1 hypothetical protein [candidate division WWE3 bacterium]